jgi:hypothetical protein
VWLSLLCKKSVIHVHSDAFAKDIQDLQCELKERDDADTRLNKRLILAEQARSRSDAKLQDHHIKIQDLIESKDQNELRYQNIESICALVPTMQKDLVRFSERLDERDGEICDPKRKNSKLFLVDQRSAGSDGGNPPEYSSLLQHLPAERPSGRHTEFNETKEGPFFMNDPVSSILLVDHSAKSLPGEREQDMLKHHVYEVIEEDDSPLITQLEELSLPQSQLSDAGEKLRAEREHPNPEELEEDDLVTCCSACLGPNEGPFTNKSVSLILPLNHSAENSPGEGRKQDEQEHHDSEEMEGDYGPFIVRGEDHFPPQSQLSDDGGNLCEEQKEQGHSNPEELREDDLVMPCSALPESNQGPVTHHSPCLCDHLTESLPDEKELERHNPEEIEADDHSNHGKLKEDGPAPRCPTILAMNNSPCSAPLPLIHPVGDLLGGEQELTAEESQEGGSAAARCPRQFQLLLQSHNIHRLIAQGPDNGPMAEHLTLGHGSSTPIPESIALWFSNHDFGVGGNHFLMNLSERNSELDSCEQLTKTVAIHLHAYGEKGFLPFLVTLQHQLQLLLATWKQRYRGFALIALWWSQLARLAVIINSKLVLSGITLLPPQPLLSKLRQSSEARVTACPEFTPTALSLTKHKVKFCVVLGLLFGGFLMLAWRRQEKTPEWSIGEGYEVAMDIYHDNVAFF